MGTHHAGFVAVRDRLHLVGGDRDNTFEPHGEVWMYDSETDSWSEAAPFPTGRSGVAGTVVDGAFHVISGGPGPGFTYGIAHERLVP